MRTPPSISPIITSTIAISGDFCDHTARIKSHANEEKLESDFGDCFKIKGGREIVQFWEENFKQNNGRFNIRQGLMDFKKIQKKIITKNP